VPALKYPNHHPTASAPMLKYSNHATAGEQLSTDAISDVFVTGKPAGRKEPPPKKPAKRVAVFL
jgi:hypothetical protein